MQKGGTTAGRASPEKVIESVGAALLCGLLAWSGPKFENLAFAVIVLLARFRGHSQSISAAVGFTAFASYVAVTHILWPLSIDSVSTLVGIWVCALLVPVHTRETKSAKGPRATSFDASLTELMPHSWSCPPSGEIESISEQSCEYAGLSHDEITEMTHIIHKIADRVPACICILDSKGELVYANKRALQSLGKAVSDVLGNQWLQCIHPEQHDEAVKDWRHCVLAHEPLDTRWRLLQSDGVYRWKHMIAAPVFDDSLRLLNWYLISVDIDRQVKAEDAIRARERDVRELLNRVPAMLTIHGRSGVEFVSNRLMNYAGLSASDITGFLWIDAAHPGDRERLRELQHKSQESNSPLNTMWRLADKHGKYRWFHTYSEPFVEDDGTVQRWYAVTTDIDERKHAEDHLRDARAKLNRASRIATIAELSASIAHELNQPLMSIMTNAQASRRWLLAEPPKLEEARNSIERVIRDGRAADETMQRIRALFKREAFKKQLTSIAEIVGEAVRLIKEDPLKREVPINCVFEKDLPEVLVDPIQIQEVFINLISNALEAMSDGQRASELKICAACTEQREVLIQVIDNGPGVEEPEKIFDAFMTTKEHGMGIGLAVSRSIVETHGGQLWAENDPKGGAIFSIKIPYADPHLPMPAE